ncbi:MAG: hypothetical protein Q8R53_00985, partial [Nanoarchaeota archaeon]|nr:hypothetical protein [Nanoarchaeota archaeon]
MASHNTSTDGTPDWEMLSAAQAQAFVENAEGVTSAPESRAADEMVERKVVTYEDHLYPPAQAIGTRQIDGETYDIYCSSLAYRLIEQLDERLERMHGIFDSQEQHLGEMREILDTGEIVEVGSPAEKSGKASRVGPFKRSLPVATFALGGLLGYFAFSHDESEELS